MTALQVEQVTDAEDTMEFLTLTTLLPDVILLDVMMPAAADGLEVSRRMDGWVRKRRIYMHTQFIYGLVRKRRLFTCSFFS